MKTIFSLAQIHIEYGQPDKNLQKGAQWIAEAASQGSQLILFPELWLTGYDTKNLSAHAQAHIEHIAELQRLAQTHQVAIAGSYLTEKAGRLQNTFTLLWPDSRPPAQYHKVHLFRMFEEDKWLRPGEHLLQTETPWGEAGLAICYDLRFPEMFRAYALHGVTLNLIVAEWGFERQYHWKTLLRARAIENQVFMAAVNAVGKTGKETFAGCSAILTPWGNPLTEGNDHDEALLTAELDLAQVAEVRNLIPVFGDRHPEVY